MPVLHTRQIPTGETVAYHEVLRFHWEAGADNLTVTLKSWESKAARDEGALLHWVWQVAVPLAAISQPLLDSIEAHLAGDDGALAGGDIIAASTDLDIAKAAAWWQVKVARDAFIASPLAVDGIGTFDADRASRELITGAVVLAQGALMASQPYSTTWTLADNSAATLDAQQMIAVGVALGMRTEAAYAAGRDARSAIDAAESVEDLASITFSAP